MALQGILGLERNPTFGLMSDYSSLDSMAKISEVAPEWSYSEGLSKFNPAALSIAPAPGFSVKNTLPADGGRPIKIEFDKGTTTLAFKYQGGICVCADSRATGGNYIGSQSVRKIIPINDYMVGTMAGGAADCTYWERILSERCRIHELRNRERISIAAASKLLANILYNYKGYGLSLGVMICGVDKRGASIYYVDNEGNRMPGHLFSVGSGSPYAYGVLDSHYRFDLTDEEAFDLGRRAIYHATHRDAASGGIVRVFSIKADGWKIISETDCKELHYKYQEEKMVST